MANRLVELEVYVVRLGLRGGFRHAAAERTHSESVVAAALLADGTVGYGEGVPRPYVTGETPPSAVGAIRDVLAPTLTRVEPKSFAELLDRVDNLPFTGPGGRLIHAARCCVELALLDAYSRYFGSPLSRVADWLGYGAFRGGGSLETVRVSGVLDASAPGKLKRRLRLMRWYGLRDFKLKVGATGDQESIELVAGRLGRALENDRASLRADANGAWDVDTAVAMSQVLAEQGFCCLEQPLAATDRGHWHMLADLTQVPLMADESLVTLEDGRYLAENDLVDDFNIRISKNGGLLPALRLAELAAKHARGIALGAMVGESAILAAAGRQFLQMVPDVRFTETGYGSFLLAEDLSRESVRFRYGGRLPPLRGPGLGVTIRRDRLQRSWMGGPARISLA